MDKELLTETKIERIRVMSRWHRSLSDAQNEVDDKMRTEERRVTRKLENEGYEYRQGVTTPYRDFYDRRNDRHRSSAERVLYFRKVDKKEKISTKESSIEETILKQKESINPETVLRNLISNKIPASKPTVEIRYRTVKIPIPGGGNIMHRIPYDVQVDNGLTHIEFSKLKIVASKLELGEAESVGLPLSDTVYKWPYDNCGSLEQSFSQDFEYQIRKGFSVEFEKTIESSSTISIELGLSYAGASASTSFSFSESVTVRNSNSYSEETIETRTGNYQFRIAPNTKNIIELAVQQFKARRKFSGDAIFEGVVKAHYQNEIVKYDLNDLLSQKERTIELRGVYSNIDYREIPVKINETKCE